MIVTEVLKKHLVEKHDASAMYIGDDTVELEHYMSVHEFYHSQEGR
jgi:hypothetical protein